MLQNAAPLRKSAPWPPNISGEHVCQAQATLQILFKSPTPTVAFETATKLSRLVLLTFDKVHNPLRLSRETKSECSKVVRTCGDFNMLTWICASRHKGVHFFDISTSKNALSMRCFAHFDFENVLHATTTCTFWTSQLPKVLRCWCLLYILAWKCASRHNGVKLFISHLPKWLRTRRFREPTFRPFGATKHWKNTVFRHFSTFFAHLHLLSSDAVSSLIFFLLRFSSLTLPTSAFHLSILSEVWLLIFLRLYRYIYIYIV